MLTVGQRVEALENRTRWRMAKLTIRSSLSSSRDSMVRVSPGPDFVLISAMSVFIKKETLFEFAVIRIVSPSFWCVAAMCLRRCC